MAVDLRKHQWARVESLVQPRMERQGGSVMDLEERIARLIDPDSWAFADRYRDELPDTAEYLVEESRTTARRVIDGLNLDKVDY